MNKILFHGICFYKSFGPDPNEFIRELVDYITSLPAAGTIGCIQSSYSGASQNIETVSDSVVFFGPSAGTYDPEWAAFLGSENV